MNVAKVYQNRADTLVSKMTQLFLTQNGVSSVTSSQWAFDVLPVSEHNSLTFPTFAVTFFWENCNRTKLGQHDITKSSTV